MHKLASSWPEAHETHFCNALASGQSSWLQIQRSGFDSRIYRIFWEVVGLERGPLSLVSTIEELLGRKSSGSGLEIREYGRRDPSGWPRDTPYPPKLALTSPTSGGRSVGIVRSWTQATEFSLVLGNNVYTLRYCLNICVNGQYCVMLIECISLLIEHCPSVWLCTWQKYSVK
jgi:hypothetical protein